jgi:hypothetical protein
MHFMTGIGRRNMDRWEKTFGKQIDEILRPSA